MAKRYHKSETLESRRDMHNDERRHDKNAMKGGAYHYDREESRSTERAHHRKMKSMGSAEHYAGMEPRRRQELEDSGMIHEDHNQVANLPQGVMMKPYGYEGGYLPEDLDDTIRGIERQKGYDNKKKLDHLYPKKV